MGIVLIALFVNFFPVSIIVAIIFYRIYISDEPLNFNPNKGHYRRRNNTNYFFNDHYSDNLDYGKEREKSVGHFLKMLEKLDNYKVFNSFYLRSDNGVYQEIDHMVIGRNGIFHIETKAYKGNISIDDNGLWSRDKYDRIENMDNPASQIDMHELLIKKVLGNNYPIQSIVNIATELGETTIIGKENCRYPVVHYKDLQSYIMNFKSDKILTDEEIKKVSYMIHSHMTNEKPTN